MPGIWIIMRAVLFWYSVLNCNGLWYSIDIGVDYCYNYLC